MSKTAKYIHLMESGDLIMIASSKQTPTDWVDLAIYIDGEILHTIHLGDSSSKVIRHYSPEFLEHEGRPTGLFRFQNVTKTDRRVFAHQMLDPFLVQLAWWEKLFSMFKPVERSFDCNNKGSLKQNVLQEYHCADLKKLEESGDLIRLL